MYWVSVAGGAGGRREDPCPGGPGERSSIGKRQDGADCGMFFFSSRRRHTRLQGDWSSDVCSSDLDLADEDVAGLDLGADAHDARLVEILERFLADVRDVARDLFLAELGVACDALELLDRKSVV